MVMNFDADDEEFVPEDAAETDDIDDADADTGALVKKLKAELKECQKERKEYLDGWQRAKADYLNSKKRFEEALKDEAPEEGNSGAWKSGLVQIQTQLTSLLAKLGVEEVRAEGEVFDPYKHEALSSQPVTTEDAHDKVLTVLQKGYVQGDTLIRPAKVIIGVHTA